MGLGLSIDTYLDDNPDATKAYILLGYEKQSLKPISFTDFIENSSSFISNPLILLEPISCNPAPIVESTIHDIPYTDTMKTFHSHFKIENCKLATQFIWIFTPTNTPKNLSIELKQFLRTAPLTKYCSRAAVDHMDVFLDCNPSITLKAALRPPNPLPTVRCSSPLRAAGQICGTSNLLLRRSLNTQMPMVGTFRLPTIQQNTIIREDQFYPPTDEMNKICEGIFIGSERAASNMQLLLDNKITHIINLSGWSTVNHFPETFTYFTVKMRDNDFEDLPQDFWDALAFLKMCRANNDVVLVHCRMGICRSQALVAAYLSEENKISIDAALNFIKTKRPGVNINPGFMDQLHAREILAQGPRRRSKPRLLIPTQ